MVRRLKYTIKENVKISDQMTNGNEILQGEVYLWFLEPFNCFNPM